MNHCAALFVNSATVTCYFIIVTELFSDLDLTMVR